MPVDGPGWECCLRHPQRNISRLKVASDFQAWQLICVAGMSSLTREVSFPYPRLLPRLLRPPSVIGGCPPRNCGRPCTGLRVGCLNFHYWKGLILDLRPQMSVGGRLIFMLRARLNLLSWDVTQENRTERPNGIHPGGVGCGHRHSGRIGRHHRAHGQQLPWQLKGTGLEP